MAEKDKEVKDEAEEESLSVADAIDKVLKKTIPPKIQDRIKELTAEHQSPYRDPPDMVAVFEVSQSAMPSIDGTNGQYVVPTGSERSRELGLSETAEFTQQALLIKDRFEVVFHPVAISEWHHKYVIVSKKEWEAKTNQNAKGAMLRGAQQMSTLMLRADV